jgi:hypothetical protein
MGQPYPDGIAFSSAMLGGKCPSTNTSQYARSWRSGLGMTLNSDAFSLKGICQKPSEAEQGFDVADSFGVQ